MTAQPFEPAVVLSVTGGLSATEAATLARLSTADRDPVENFRHLLTAIRVGVIAKVRDMLGRNEVPLTHAGIAAALDLAWALTMPHTTPLAVPMIGNAYIQAAKVATEPLPREIVESLAAEHARRIGTYFHATSKDAMLQGFNTLVNQRVPARAALDRTLEAYGLTKRQMSGFTSFDDTTKVATAMPRDLTARRRRYIGRSLASRFKGIAGQEAHNLDAQASQVVWSYLVEKGIMDASVEKIWITARDERVCEVCGPLHGKVVPVTERFEVKGQKFWVPGAHVNCRCWVRIREPLRNWPQPVSKAAAYGISYTVDTDFDESKHRRDDSGRFTFKPKLSTRDVDEDFKALVAQVQHPRVGHADVSADTLHEMYRHNTGLKHVQSVQQAIAPTVAKPPATTAEQKAATMLAVVQALETPTRPESQTALRQATADVIAEAIMANQTTVTVDALTAVNPKVDLQTVADSMTKVDTSVPTEGFFGVMTYQIPQAGNVFETKIKVYQDRQAALEAAQMAHQVLVNEHYERILDRMDEEDRIELISDPEGFDDDVRIKIPDEYGAQTKVLGDYLRTFITDFAANKGEIEGVHLWNSPEYPNEMAEEWPAEHLAEVLGLEHEDFRVNLVHVDPPPGWEHLADQEEKITPVEIAGRFEIENLDEDDDDAGHGLPGYIRAVHLKRAEDGWAE